MAPLKEIYEAFSSEILKLEWPLEILSFNVSPEVDVEHIRGEDFCDILLVVTDHINTYTRPAE